MATFKYDDKGERRDCIAYIDEDGDLVVRSADNEGVCVSSDLLLRPGIEGVAWLPDKTGVRHHFYRGDSITITF